MTRPSNLLVSTVLRNQRFRGPTSSAQQNDFQAEVIRDVTRIQEQWNDLIVPLSARIPDGTLDSDVNAFKDGLDGRTLFANSDADTNTGTGQYFVNTLNRPTTVYEQFQDVYNTIDTAVTALENQISESGGGGGLTSSQQAAIGANIFNASLTSSPTSLDGRSQQNQNNVLQVAKDLYGPAYATFSGTGTEILTNSVRDMVDALLQLHSGTWDTDITLEHSFSADDITGGTLSQEVVGDSASTGTGINDTYAGSPTNLVEDLNLIRAQIRSMKDASSGWSTTLSLNANWNPLATEPTDLQLLTEVKGSAARSDTNPWGYDYTDVDGLNTRLTAEQSYTGRSSLTDTTPSYSSVLGFNQGDDLTTAIGGLAAAAGGGDVLLLAAEVSGHLLDLNNPHDTSLDEAAAAGGFAPAGQISIVDSGSHYTSLFAEGALQEVATSAATQSGLLNAQINAVDSTLTTVSGTLQGQIDSNDTDISTLQGDLTTLDGRVTTAEGDITTVESDINTIQIGSSHRRYEESVSSLPNDSSITITHSGGMYPQAQVITHGNLATAGYNGGAVLPIHTTVGGDIPGVLIEHSGVDHLILTNKLDDTLASGVVVVNW